MKLPKIYVSHRLETDISLPGHYFPRIFYVKNYAEDCVGFLPVFSSKKAALKNCKEISEGYPSGIIPRLKYAKNKSNQS